MRTRLRPLLATFTGSVVTIVLSYLGAVLLLVARMGIPLGAEGRDPTRGEYVGLLVIAGGAAAIGGHIAAGIARQESRALVAVLAALMAAGLLWGFAGSASRWPGWWAPALATAVAAGTWLGGVVLRPGRTAIRMR